MNDEQLDKILKKALTPQREIKEEEIVLKKRRKEEKMMRKKRMKMAGIAGTVAAALALACIVPQTSFAEQLKKMFQGYWGQRSELSDYVTRGVFSDQDEHMIFSVEEILSDEVVVSAVVRYEAKDETGEKWLATKGPAGSESYDENGNLRSTRQWGNSYEKSKEINSRNHACMYVYCGNWCGAVRCVCGRNHCRFAGNEDCQ